MKKLYLIALSAICMLVGTSLMAENTLNITNNWWNPISVHLKAKHKKAGKTRHNEGTITVNSGTTGNTGTWNYNGDIEFAIFTDTVTNKSVKPWPFERSSTTIANTEIITSDRAHAAGSTNKIA